MPPYDRAVIGAGTSAAVYLCYFPQREKERVAVIGLPEPWGNRGSHRMGQPPQLLELPMNVDPRHNYTGYGFEPKGHDVPMKPLHAPSRVPRLRGHYEPLPPSSEAPQGPFLTSSRYAQSVSEILRPYEVLPARVVEISGGKPYTIRLDRGEPVTADSVIVASGPGTSRASKAYKRPEYDGRPDLFCSGEAFLDHSVKVRRDTFICVEGGSATAAWAVEKALINGARGVFWFQRSAPGDTREARFAAAFPAGGRNEWLKANEHKITWCLANVASSAPREGRIEVAFENGLRVVCDQYVASIGAGGGLNLLHPSLRDKMKPIRDDRRQLDPLGKAVLGLCNEDGSLLAVGPAIFETNKTYSDANSYLPRAARPPEGIPTIIATIAALRRVLGGDNRKWIDFNLQSFTDLDEYFYNAVGFFLAAGLEKSKAPEGLFRRYSLKQVAQFVTDQVIGTRIMKSSSFGVSETEMEKIFSDIWDFAYKHLGRARQEEWEPLLDAYYSK